MWNVRIFVGSLVEQGLSALKQASKGLYTTKAFDHTAVIKGNNCIQSKNFGKEFNKGGAIIAETVGNSIASSQGGVGGVGSGVICRLRPVTSRLVQSLVRKVSSPLWSEAKRRATKRLVYGETAPFFALVGVTLVSGSEQGILTKDDELESLCGNIRDAISRVGWLHNPDYWKDHSYEGRVHHCTDEEDKQHVFSLADLELGNVIDKGCNAVVHAAKWKKAEVNLEDNTSIPSTSSSSDQLSTISSNDGEDIYSSSNTLSNEVLNNLNERDDEYFTASDSEDLVTNMHRSVSQYIDIPTRSVLSQRHRSTSLTEDVSKLLSDGRFLLPPRHKKVKFKDYGNEDSSDSDNEDGVVKITRAKKKLRNVSEDVVLEDNSNITMYPLAVKMMFNYEAESNAPAIISAMYKELIPARTLQLTDTLRFWKERFLSNMNTLSPHCNIVDMPCVFVDRVPSLRSSMELYPDALPTRLNPEGCGRNMSLFCVMKRYDMSLSDYLTLYAPSHHTSLLMMTQLLEAVLHINNNNIAHRDMKSDNILISLSDGWEYPLLVLSDFGCCVADQSANLRIPFPSYESDPRQGNTAMMAPEIKNATPGLIKRIDYSKSDLWAVGAIAFEMFGHENPFMPTSNSHKPLDSSTYRDHNIPRLPKDIPGAIRRLILDLLRRNPANRPSPNVAATLCQLMLWAPRKWLNRHALKLPSHKEISQWLLCLTTKVLCEARMTHPSKSQKLVPHQGSGMMEYQLVSTLLSRVKYSDVIQAIKWNRSF